MHISALVCTIAALSLHTSSEQEVEVLKQEGVIRAFDNGLTIHKP